MKKLSRVPFRILGSHGVPPAQIAVLEYRFGPLVPGSIEGPDDLVAWAFMMLPWSAQAPVLRGWLEKAFRKGEVDPTDSRARRVLATLADEGAVDTSRTEDEIHDLVETLARLRGVQLTPGMDGGELSQQNIGDDIRAWAAAWASLAAARAAQGHRFADANEGTQAATAVYHWVVSQGERGLSQNRAIDVCLQDVVAQLATFVGGWAKGAKA